MAEFTVEGVKFKSGKLPPKVQLRVLKRLARLAPGLKDAGGLAAQLKEGQRPSIDDIASTLSPIVTAFADLPDNDVEFVIDTCMQATEWQDASVGNWFPVQRPDGTIGHQDNQDLMRSLTITWNVLQDNFASLFSATSAAVA